MVLASSLVAGLLVTGTAFAAPFTQQRREAHAARLARNRKTVGPLAVGATNLNDRIVIEKNTTHAQYSNNWSGAVYEGNGVNQVSATVTVPGASGQNGAGSSAWVGIDGDTCQSAILQTGIDMDATNSYSAWYEWYPDYAYNFQIDISEGDEIFMEVVATSKTAGKATIQNKSTGKSVSHSFTNEASEGSLCMKEFECIVERYEENGGLVPLANFGKVTFTGATGTSNGQTVDIGDGSTIIDMQTSSGSTEVTCSASGSTLTCTHQG